MRKSLALFSALALFASPFFFACFEAERLLGWPDAVYRWFDPWLLPVVIVPSSLITAVLLWIVAVFDDEDCDERNSGSR